MGPCCRRGGGGGGTVLYMNSYMFQDLSYLFWYGSPRYDRMQQRRGRRGEMGFLESIFSFVFGDGNPNLDFEERRWKLVCSLPRCSGCLGKQHDVQRHSRLSKFSQLCGLQSGLQAALCCSAPSQASTCSSLCRATNGTLGALQVGELISRSGGVVTAEQLAPYLDQSASSSDAGALNEDFVVPALVRFGGSPEVDQQGNLLYRFPSLQVRTGEYCAGG